MNLSKYKNNNNINDFYNESFENKLNIIDRLREQADKTLINEYKCWNNYNMTNDEYLFIENFIKNGEYDYNYFINELKYYQSTHNIPSVPQDYISKDSIKNYQTNNPYVLNSMVCCMRVLTGFKVQHILGSHWNIWKSYKTKAGSKKSCLDSGVPSWVHQKHFLLYVSPIQEYICEFLIAIYWYRMGWKNKAFDKICRTNGGLFTQVRNFYNGESYFFKNKIGKGTYETIKEHFDIRALEQLYDVRKHLNKYWNELTGARDDIKNY